MRRNVAAGIGSNEQGEYCRAALQRWIAKSRDINRLLYFTLLYKRRTLTNLEIIFEEFQPM